MLSQREVLSLFKDGCRVSRHWMDFFLDTRVPAGRIEKAVPVVSQTRVQPIDLRVEIAEVVKPTDSSKAEREKPK